MFAKIRGLNTEQERLAEIKKINSGNYKRIKYKWEKIVEQKLKKKNELWYIRKSGADLEEGPVTRTAFGPGVLRLPGLVGFRTENCDFDDPVLLDTLRHADQNWTGRSGQWAGYWTGYIKAPYTGIITFASREDNWIELNVNEKVLIDTPGGWRNERTGSINMIKDKIYPVRIWYSHVDGPSYFKLYWCWKGHKKSFVTNSAFSYGPENIRHAQKFLK